jgi:hypothetical protein
MILFSSGTTFEGPQDEIEGFFYRQRIFERITNTRWFQECRSHLIYQRWKNYNYFIDQCYVNSFDPAVLWLDLVPNPPPIITILYINFLILLTK